MVLKTFFFLKRLHVLITGYYPTMAILYTNDGNGVFTVELDTPFTGVVHGSIAFADIDNDDDQDVLITGSADYNTDILISELYSNNGGIFTEVLETPFDGVFYSVACGGGGGGLGLSSKNY